MPVQKEPQTRWGWFVRRERNRRNWSQTELAERLGIAKSTVMDMEIGPERKVSIARVRIVSEVFALPFALVMEEAGLKPEVYDTIDPQTLNPDEQKLLAVLREVRPDPEDLALITDLLERLAGKRARGMGQMRSEDSTHEHEPNGSLR